MRFRLSNYRRVIQAFFFLLFLILLGLSAKKIVLPFPTELFLVSNPLVVLVSLLTGLPFKWEFLFALVTVTLTLLFGRIFCGYACPMGTFLDLFSPLSRILNIKRGSFKKLKPLPLLTLSVVVVASAFGANLLMLLDPIALITRTTSVTVFPGIDFVLSKVAERLYLSGMAARLVDGTVSNLTGVLIFAGQRAFVSVQWMVLLFIFIVSLNTLSKRFWCRYLCPLGGLLGLVARVPFYRRTVEVASCSNCLKCVKTCKMEAAVNADGLKTDTASCVLCLECRNACPQDAISRQLKPELTSEMPSRRTAIATVGATVAAAYLTPVRSWPEPDHLTLIRPPGAMPEDKFLDKCIRCGNCLKACPTNVLQPAMFQYGVNAIWTPHQDFRKGVCDWTCNTCGKVCPTGAIQHLTLKNKRKFVVGRAEIDRKKCIPWLVGHGCLVCQAYCPLPDKAIIVKEEPAQYGKINLMPYVDLDKCIGCGICEYKCPVRGRKAIIVFPPAVEVSQYMFSELDDKMLK